MLTLTQEGFRHIWRLTSRHHLTAWRHGCPGADHREVQVCCRLLTYCLGRQHQRWAMHCGRSGSAPHPCRSPGSSTCKARQTDNFHTRAWFAHVWVSLCFQADQQLCLSERQLPPVSRSTGRTVYGTALACRASGLAGSAASACQRPAARAGGEGQRRCAAPLHCWGRRREHHHSNWLTGLQTQRLFSRWPAAG